MEDGWTDRQGIETYQVPPWTLVTQALKTWQLEGHSTFTHLAVRMDVRDTQTGLFDRE